MDVEALAEVERLRVLLRHARRREQEQARAREAAELARQRAEQADLQAHGRLAAIRLLARSPHEDGRGKAVVDVDDIRQALDGTDRDIRLAMEVVAGDDRPSRDDEEAAMRVTMYMPVAISSAEQAEALPDGTVAIREGHFACEKRWRGWYDTDVEEWGDADMIGWTALVPVEARYQEGGDRIDPEVEQAPSATSHRFVTEWEEAPPRLLGPVLQQ